MDYELTEEQKLIQETAYKFAVNEIEPIAKECDREERYPRDVWKKACETGLVGAFIPEAYGGPGFGFVELALITEQLSRIDLGIGTVIITATFGSENIFMFGTEEQKKKYLPLLANGEAVSAGAYTEPDAGTDVAATRTKAVRDGKTTIFPANWEGVYFEWMDNIKDWCISRQIWWGHRIPAWYCQECGEVQVAKEAPVSCNSCQSHDLVQETDVLDTWFSSALWPFSTLGWPDSTPELKTFYPTAVLVTGFDILFFWVARMMMMGIHFMGDIPFKDVYIHALVRDAEGKKMSKSKGNVIDPLEIMDQFGTDAFRFTLAALAAQGRDIKLSEETIVGYRHFVNKIWNAARFALMNLDENEGPKHDERVYTLADRWILTRLGQVSEEVARAIEAYQFNEAAGHCYQFIWHELCDWYFEMAKQELYGEDGVSKETARAVVQETLMVALKLLHPFMPFITEEIWQRLPGTDGSIMTARFPDPSDFLRDEDALKEMNLLMGVIAAIRNIRGEMNIPPSKNVNLIIDTKSERDEEILERNLAYIQTLARVDSASIGSGLPKPEKSATAIFEETSVHVLLEGLIDFEGEKKRIRKAINKIEKDMETLNKKLSNRGFLEKAPAEIVADVRTKFEGFSTKLSKLKHNLSFLETIDDG